jgi:hypothetical protein
MDKLGTEFDTRWERLRNDLAAIGLHLERGSIIETEYFLRRKDALLSKAARLEGVRNELIELFQKGQAEEHGYFEQAQRQEARFTFNTLPSQIDPYRTFLLTARDGDSIDPFEIDEKVIHVKSLRESFDVELEALRARVPAICVYGPTGGPNKNISFFVTSNESAEQQYPHTSCLDFYELVAREGPVYNDISTELSEIENHLQQLLEQYT